MAEGNVSGPPLPTVKTNKPVSEALLNEKVRRTAILSSTEALQLLWPNKLEVWASGALSRRPQAHVLSLDPFSGTKLGYAADIDILQWDRAISSLVVRSTLGFSFGVIFSVLLFKRRTWPVWLGTGFGAGRAWEEADGTFGM